jgi:hypothetical protein
MSTDSQKQHGPVMAAADNVLNNISPAASSAAIFFAK